MNVPNTTSISIGSRMLFGAYEEPPWSLFGEASDLRQHTGSKLPEADLSHAIKFHQADPGHDSPDKDSGCRAATPAAWVGMAIYMAAWGAASIMYWRWSKNRQEAAGDAAAWKRQCSDELRTAEEVPATKLSSAPDQDSAPARDPRWDRVRFHLMNFIIWSHWLGKWGAQETRAGWAALCFAFSFHVLGFVVLSGIFSEKYAANAARRGPQELLKTVWNCLDLLVVYVIFSWLRGLVEGILLHSRSVGQRYSWAESLKPASEVFVTTAHNTFLFRQGPWYLAALILWRLSALLIWRMPAVVGLLLSVAVGVLCPYDWLSAVRDPFALREVLHYSPYFCLGLFCGQRRLEQLVDWGGRWTFFAAFALLTALFTVIWFPLGEIFFQSHDPSVRWVLLKKAMPPAETGGVGVMLALYAMKSVATLAALCLFSAPMPMPLRALDRTIEAAGSRSMCVYMVHMVFIVVPGEALCPQQTLLARGGFFGSVLLYVLALLVNLLCGSELTAWLFRPLTEPLGTMYRAMKQRDRNK